MKERIIKYLEGLASGTIEPWDVEQGLCYSLEQEGLHIPKLGKIIETWDKYSGDDDYPVPDPAEAEADPYLKYHNTADIWTGEYGELRRELCQYIADYIKENRLPVDYDYED